MELSSVQCSVNARKALNKEKEKRGGVKMPVILDDILIKAGLLNKDGSVKDK